MLQHFVVDYVTCDVNIGILRLLLTTCCISFISAGVVQSVKWETSNWKTVTGFLPGAGIFVFPHAFRTLLGTAEPRCVEYHNFAHAGPSRSFNETRVSVYPELLWTPVPYIFLWNLHKNSTLKNDKRWIILPPDYVLGLWISLAAYFMCKIVQPNWNSPAYCLLWTLYSHRITQKPVVFNVIEILWNGNKLCIESMLYGRSTLNPIFWALPPSVSAFSKLNLSEGEFVFWCHPVLSSCSRVLNYIGTSWGWF
jgi:hypothetical protein